MKNSGKHTRKTQKNKQPVNIWRWVSLILIGLILGTGIFIGSKIFVSPAPQNLNKNVDQADEPVFSVDLTKKQVNRLASYYLQHYLKDDKVKYTFKLTDQAILGGTFKFMGVKLPFTLAFDPYVLENGDIQLQADNLAIGSLPIPMTQVLNFVGNDFHLPKWVSLNAKKGIIVLHLRKYQTDGGMSFRAEHIDLDEDQIELSVYLPQ